MNDLRDQQRRVRQLGRRAKWFTALAVTVPAALLSGGVVLGGVALTEGGSGPATVCATGLLIVGSAVTFLLLREQAQNALEEAALIRRLRAAALTPTNAGQPVRTTYRKVEQPWLPAKNTTSDPELTALLAAATAGTDVSHASSSSHDAAHVTHHADHSTTHSHSHSQFDHSAVHTHVHVDVSSF
ncbi:hypothetical protein ACWGJ9_11810 [Curtobacterium citreum]